MILACGQEIHLVLPMSLVQLALPFTIAASQLRWLSIHHSDSTRTHEDFGIIRVRYLTPSFWLAGLELKRLLQLGAMDVNDS
jgi:hypothetical protein